MSGSAAERYEIRITRQKLRYHAPKSAAIWAVEVVMQSGLGRPFRTAALTVVDRLTGEELCRMEPITDKREFAASRLAIEDDLGVLTAADFAAKYGR